MCNCRAEPESFPKVHLLLTTMKEYVQGVQDFCDPCVKQKGSNRRSRTPSGGERVCKRISGGVLRMPPERELEFTIDLRPCTELIERTPYHMSTSKLQELKM
jgi:hypothetical protein